MIGSGYTYILFVVLEHEYSSLHIKATKTRVGQGLYNEALSVKFRGNVLSGP